MYATFCPSSIVLIWGCPFADHHTNIVMSMAVHVIPEKMGTIQYDTPSMLNGYPQVLSQGLRT
jgi:hypothetical protein